jgi:hypothetical protein
MIIDQIVRLRIFRIIVIGFVFSATLLLAFLMPRIISSRFLMVVSFIPLLIAVSIIFLHYSPLGVVALVVADLLIPFSIGTGTQTNLGAPVILLGFLSGLWVLDVIVNNRNLKLFDSQPILPLFCLVGVVFLAFLNGQLPWYSLANQVPLTAQLGALALFVLSAFAFILVGFRIRAINWLKWLVFLFLGLAAFYILGRVSGRIGVYTNRLFDQGIAGSLFWVWLVSLAVSQALLNRSLSWGWRLGLFTLALSAFYIGIIQNVAWTSGWLPALISAGFIFWLAFPRLRPWAVILIGGILFWQFNKISALLMAGDNSYSMMTRFEAWTIIGKIVQASPILGLGPANYYAYTPLFPILGYSVQFNSHNNYVDLVAQTGFLGLACFLWFAWSVGRLGWRLKSSVQDGFQKAYVIGALGGLVGTLVAGMFGDWVIPFVYNIGFAGFRASVLGWLFLGGIVTLDKYPKEEPIK